MLLSISILVLSLTGSHSIAKKSKSSFNAFFGRHNHRTIAPNHRGDSCTPLYECPDFVDVLRLEKININALCGDVLGVQYVRCELVGTPGPRCGVSRNNYSLEWTPAGLTGPGNWPWMALVYGRNDLTGQTTFKCRGSLIAEEWVLTAAECVPRYSRDKLVYVRLGFLNVGSIADYASSIDVEIKEFIRHPDYRVPYGPLSSNIALIRLSRPVDYDEHIFPICLHTEMNNAYYHRKRLFTAGLSYESLVNLDSSTQFKDAETKVVSNAECSSKYNQYFFDQVKIDKTVICAEAASKDICHAHIGAPLMFEMNGTWYQTGIVSLVPTCVYENHSPAVYTKVAPFADWISTTTGLIL